MEAGALRRHASTAGALLVASIAACHTRAPLMEEHAPVDAGLVLDGASAATATVGASDPPARDAGATPLVTPDAPSAADAATSETTDRATSVPRPAACPAQRAEQGTKCRKVDLECDYGTHACGCTRTTCFTPAGPVPNCTSELIWLCRDDGCPALYSAACNRDGLACDTFDGMCAVRKVCRHGRWTPDGEPSCPPVAPHPVAPPL